jgi:magnesium-transporting ATPase (P-type)
MDSTFTKEIGIQAWMLILVGVLLVAIIAFAVWAIVNIRDIKTPKFGFGGKPLTTAAFVIVLAIFLPVTVLVVQQRVETIQYAASLNDVSLTTFEIVRYDTQSDIAFSAIPISEGTAWADNTYSFEWTITGIDTYTFQENDRTIDDPSYFVLTLPHGNYIVEVKVSSKDFEVIKTSQLTVD